MSDEPEATHDGEPSSDQVVALLFAAAMSGDEAAWARENDVDPKLLQMWRFTHGQEYITYLEKVLRMIRTRAEATD